MLHSTQASLEIHEGTTYQSGCALVDMDVDTEEIPPAMSCPDYARLQAVPAHSIVVFDIRITGLGNDCEVTQLAACRLSDHTDQISQYVLPNRSISKETTRVTVSVGQPVDDQLSCTMAKKFHQFLGGG